jgi:putative ATP-binding cassette transporter
MEKFTKFRKKAAEIWQLISPYWRSEEKYKAGSLLILILAINLGYVYAGVSLNAWGAKFYDAIQQLAQATFISQCYAFLGLVAIVVPIFIANEYFTSLLGFNWRKWLTKYYLNRWMDKAVFYRLSLQDNKVDNPDQRLSQDLSSFATGVLMMTISFFKEILNLGSFIFILWTISGALQFSLLDKTFTIPGYMVWAVLIYAAIGTYGVYKIGRPLFHLDFENERAEANFRYQLIRFRERAEEIALYQGEKTEFINFRQSFNFVYENFRKIINRKLYVSSWINSYNNLSTIFPILVMAPRFFSGALTFGVLMQIGSAFSQVQNSLSIIVANFDGIASLIATSNRILGFSEHMEKMEASLLNPSSPTIELLTHSEDTLILDNLKLKTPNNQLLIENLNLTIQKGEKVLLMGRSGLGKSTLLRAMAGLWSFGEGKIKLPANQKLFLVPQRPYMPLGTLRQGLFYPGIERDISDAKLLEILMACRLDHLAPQLDHYKDWGFQLSMGEQQRIIFVRAILHEPAWLMMDEPSANMDKETEMQVYLALHHYLPESTIITIGHSPNLRAFHSRILELGLDNVNLETSGYEYKDEKVEYGAMLKIDSLDPSQTAIQ